MKNALIGFGALGRYMKDVLLESPDINEDDFHYFDDNLHAEGAAHSYPFKDYVNDEFKDDRFYVCLGYKHLKVKNEIIGKLVALGRHVPHYVHSSSYAHPTTKFGPGVFIYPGVNIDRGAVIGRGSWIANGSVIAHDCTIGEVCWFGATVTLCGKVTIGSATFIGSGAVISNDVHVGDNVIIGLSSAITKHIPNDVSAIGNPMRILDKMLKLV